ncbi:MAG TPA: DUF4397 domain-containing protein [Nocardioides sp.]|uniref:DUF4397 domain-containing protein n=1 Tax=Nocardioides sp. TaxID=35761 RepID=UPI002E2F5194|nr:DUF4397 domain-containing protein [Nocardioides sp.]HEX5087280.1 DUF4397 domain-containing protein [Nocardioides sp.]
MYTRNFRAAVAAVALVVGAVVTTSVASDARVAPRAAIHNAGVGRIAIVQAVPKLTLTVSVDGEQVQQDVAEGTIVGPLDLSAGSHDVTFTDGTGDIASSVDVTAGESSDVVVHRPAEVGGTPVVSVYPTSNDPIAPGKARVLLAHTATTAPADVVVDGQTVFTNIANGEYAQADVAAGPHQVSLLPAGVTGKPILGPLDVTLKAGTITSVYAVGNPKDGSMNVIVRTTTGTESGGAPPSGIDTGSAGLVSGVHVWTFAG